MSTQGSDILQARSFVHALIQRFWQIKLSEAGFSESFPIRALFDRSSSPVQITQQEQLEVQSLSDTLSKLNLIEASFKIGEIYTAKLPKEYRAQYGIYFTPPALTSRLLDNAESSGIDWGHSNVIDPACGGGAFLAPVALRMKDSLKKTGIQIAK